MKKIIIILSILFSTFLYGCSIDWNNEKENNIEELNNKNASLEENIEELNNKNINDITLTENSGVNNTNNKIPLKVDCKKENYKEECLVLDGFKINNLGDIKEYYKSTKEEGGDNFYHTLFKKGNEILYFISKPAVFQSDKFYYGTTVYIKEPVEETIDILEGYYKQPIFDENPINKIIIPADLSYIRLMIGDENGKIIWGEEKINENNVGEFDVDLSNLNYMLPLYSKVCIPNKKQSCNEQGCINIKPTVFILYDENSELVYRCDNKPCDKYEIKSSISGNYIYLEPILPRGFNIKLSSENKYIESVTYGLNTLVSYGECINNLNYANIIKYPGTAIYYDINNINENTKKIQTRLNELNYNIKIDGYFGNETKNAILDFQKNNNLEQDSIVGKNTWNILFNTKDVKKKIISTQTYFPIKKVIPTKETIYYNTYSTIYDYDDGYDWAEENDIDNFDDCQYEFDTGDAEDGCNEYVKENYTGYQTFGSYDCTEDCSGHEAGYEWAEENDIDDEYDCDGNSNSFNEGCIEYVEENY